MLKSVFSALLAFLLMHSVAFADDTAIAPLPVDKAFAFSVWLDRDNQVVLEWNIAPGYYLYRNQLKFTPTSFNHTALASLKLPEGLPRRDMLHGNYQAYMGSLKIPIASIHAKKGVLDIRINYQGCSSAGFCYTPVKKTLKVDLSRLTSEPQNLTQYVATAGERMEAPATNDDISGLFENHHLPIIILSFLGLGLLLAFTPCVLPMVPILSGIIIGQGKNKTRRKSFLLSLVYVSGMAVTYAIAGIVIALIGSNIQTALQRPWIIVLFSGLFVLLALSLFGFYELQLPARFRKQVTELSNKQSGGTWIGVFLMGSLSTLIVSPCVSAPLVGVLAYIGQTGDVLLGALSLLALGIGMGIPLLLIGVSADRLLPKAGLWMTWLEKIFGFVMLGLAIWMLSRMIPGPVTLFLWAILFIIAAIYLGLFSTVPNRLQWLTKGLAVGLITYSIILLVGSAKGSSDLFNPWMYAENKTTDVSSSVFTPIHDNDELTQALVLAEKNAQPVLLDFYADWCSSCVVMDRTVFSRDDVQQALKKFKVLRIDLTQNTDFDKMILQRFNLVGPPGIIFFNQNGLELTSPRIIGEVNAEEFLAQLMKVS